MQKLVRVKLSVEAYVREQFHKQMRPPSQCPNCGRFRRLSTDAIALYVPPRLRRLMMIDHIGRHLCQGSHSRIIKELTDHIDTTERIYCHRLRHTFATEMARAGMPLPALMKLLGHKTPKMTMRYVQVAQLDVRQAYDQALPQLAVIRSVEDRAFPALPVPSTPLPADPGPDQPLNLMSTVIDRLESLRCDATDPALDKQLQCFIKRMRKAGLDLTEIL